MRDCWVGGDADIMQNYSIKYASKIRVIVLFKPGFKFFIGGYLRRECQIRNI